MATKTQRQSTCGEDADQQLVSGDGEGVRVVAMCTFEAVQDYELGFRQYDVLTAVAKAEEDPTWWVGQIGGKIGLFPSECVEVLKGYTDRLPLFKIFLNDDPDANDSMTNDTPGEQPASPSASTESLDSTPSSTELEITPRGRQRASTQPEVDVALVNCYRCNTQVRIKKGQSFYPCECGANVKRPDDDDGDAKSQVDNNRSSTRKRRNTTAGGSVGGGGREKEEEEESPKERKKREKRERELKRKQDEEERRRREEERKFREKRDKGRLSESQWNRQVDSARERLWRASVIMTSHANDGTDNGNDDDDGSTVTEGTLSTMGSSTIDIDAFEDARSDSPRDISSFSSASSGRSLGNSLSGVHLASDSSESKTKPGKKATKEQKTKEQKTKEQKRKEKEEKRRLKKIEKEEKEEKRKTEKIEKKRRNSLFSSSGTVATSGKKRNNNKNNKNKDKLTNTGANGKSKSKTNAVVTTINPITANAKRQQQQMKARTMVRTKEGKVMSLEEVEREGKKSNWDVSKLFSVRIIGGGRAKHHYRVDKKSSSESVSTATQLSTLALRAAQQERELQEAARKLEEERKRFAEERQKFEEERLKVMLVLAQEMEGVKMARDGTPMYPSPATHPALLLVPTNPSPIPSFAAAQSSFTSLPSTSRSSSLAGMPTSLPSSSAISSPMPSSLLSTTTSMSTSSLPSLVYNPSLVSLPTTVASGAAADVSSSSSSTESSDSTGTADVSTGPVSPRKPPPGGVFLPFLMEARTNHMARRPTRPLDDEVALLEEKLLDQLQGIPPDDDEVEVDKNINKEADSETSSDDEEEEENDEEDESASTLSSGSEDLEEEEVVPDNQDAAKLREVDLTTAPSRDAGAVDYLEYVEADDDNEKEDDDDDEEKTIVVVQKKDKAQQQQQRRKITVAPIQGIDEMKKDDEEDKQQRELEGSWVTAISPRERLVQERERQRQRPPVLQQQKADAGKDPRKDVIVRPSTSAAAWPPADVDNDDDDDDDDDLTTTKKKKVSFGGAAVWTSAESPRRKLESMRAEGASQAEINREKKRMQAELELDIEETKKMKNKNNKNNQDQQYEHDIDRLLEKMNQLRERSSSDDDDSWGSSSTEASDVDKKVRVDKKALSEEEEGEDEEDGASIDESPVVLPEWKRGPPRSLQEMREYKEFVRMRYEAEKRETERMLKRKQREMRTRVGSASSRDERGSWII